MILVQASAAIAQYKKAPDWVKSTPTAPDALFGIGISLANTDGSHRSMARNLALREIAEKICVNINATSIVTGQFTSATEVPDYALDEQITTVANNFLTGYEKVDDWLNRKTNEYYVLYRLQRSVYRQNRDRYFTQVEEIVGLLEQEAADLGAAGKLVRSVNKLVMAISRVEQEMALPMEPRYHSRLQKVKVAGLIGLEQQISRLSYNLADEYLFYPAARQPLEIPLFAKDSLGRPIHSPTTYVSVLSGDLFNFSINHGPAGQTLKVSGMYPVNGAVRIQLHTDFDVPQAIRSQLDPSLWQRLKSRIVTLRYVPYAVYFDTREYAEGKPDASHRLTNYIKFICNDLGITAANDPAQALYHCIIRADQRAIAHQGARGNIASSYDVRITLVRSRDDNTLFDYTLPRSQAKGSTLAQARNNAYNKTLSQMDEFLATFVTFLCTRQDF